ncbi:MAG: M13 family metallopeptidase [Bacilli bacterium]|nr:M13 family metallopeptidase [Bacilli bacterium]
MKELPRIQDDLYEAVNGEWLETAVIPDDRPTTGGFATLDEEVTKLLIADLTKFSSKGNVPEIPAFKDAVSLYGKVLDVKRREEEGITPILSLLQRIQGLKTVEDLNTQLGELAALPIELPFRFYVATDMADATKHCFALIGPGLILPDVPYYAPEHPAGKALLGVYSQMATAALAFSPLSEEEKVLYVKDTLEFDALLSTSAKSQVEWADYVHNHNPMKAEEVAKQLAPLDFDGFLKALFGKEKPEIVVVYEPKAIEKLSSHLEGENFIKFVHWCYVKTLLRNSNLLSPTLRAIGGIYRRTLTGQAADPSIEKDAFNLASRTFSEPIGVYYGRTYFGEEAKKDVVAMVKEIIETYKRRVKVNPILSEETREKAILKLSTIEIKMGYPDFVHPIYEKMKVEQGDSLYATMEKLEKILFEDNLSKLHEEVDRQEWAMPGHMVNACYDPSKNDITFPAAILQKPFYSLSQPHEANLGGIGAVIGHEISHAFDNNGSHFDEKGNLASWWKEEDFARFKEKTDAMIALWDGIPFHGGKVNGTLVVSENIADCGGVAVTLEIMDHLPNADYQEYFRNWARVWCVKAKEEYIQLLLANDVHSPAKLRANMPPRYFPQWYEAFGVKETDAMYLPPEKRIVIW